MKIDEIENSKGINGYLYFNQFTSDVKWYEHDNYLRISMYCGISNGEDFVYSSDIDGMSDYFPNLTEEERQCGNPEKVVHERSEIIAKNLIKEEYIRLKSQDIKRKESIFRVEKTKYLISDIDKNHVFYERVNSLPVEIYSHMSSRYRFFGYMIGLLDGFILKARYDSDNNINKYILYRSKIAEDFMEYTSLIPTIDELPIYNSICSYPDNKQLNYFYYEIFLKSTIHFGPDYRFITFYKLGYVLSSSSLNNIDSIIDLYNKLIIELKNNLKDSNSKVMTYSLEDIKKTD